MTLYQDGHPFDEYPFSAHQLTIVEARLFITHCKFQGVKVTPKMRWWGGGGGGGVLIFHRMPGFWELKQESG